MPDAIRSLAARHALPPVVVAELGRALADGRPATAAVEAGCGRLLALCPALPLALARSRLDDVAQALAAPGPP